MKEKPCNKNDKNKRPNEIKPHGAYTIDFNVLEASFANTVK